MLNASRLSTNIIVTALVTVMVFLLPWLDRHICQRLGVNLHHGVSSNPNADALLQLRQLLLFGVFAVYIAAYAYLVFLSRGASAQYMVHIDPFADLQKATVRSEMLVHLFEKLYEDNVAGKVTDEWFLQLSHKYEVERLELKEKISKLHARLAAMEEQSQNSNAFLAAIRKFMEMKTLTAPLLQELIDHIDVYEAQGSGKSRTQRIVIYYRFVGYIELPDSAFRCSRDYRSGVRQGVEIEYIPRPA